jgi:ABC-type multidrug transport system fused ATPase/permease subunit
LLVFHEGFIIEDGTLKELLNLNKHFAILWKKQKDGLLYDN